MQFLLCIHCILCSFYSTVPPKLLSVYATLSTKIQTNPNSIPNPKYYFTSTKQFPVMSPFMNDITISLEPWTQRVRSSSERSHFLT